MQSGILSIASQSMPINAGWSEYRLFTGKLRDRVWQPNTIITS